MITLDQIKAAAKTRIGEENARSYLAGLRLLGSETGLDAPHRYAQLTAQVMHESLGFVYDKEIWGPTRAQLGYEGRNDLGNVRQGDGKRFRGRGPIQVTGRANYRRFTQWAKLMRGDAPDFEAEPAKLLTDPWEGISPIWYWDSGNPTGKTLNRYADRGDAEMITRLINGGLNGYSDRLDYLVRLSLVLLGLGPREVRRFQQSEGLAVDGIAGPATRRALHEKLVGMRIA